jgi:hypothetical protein
VTVLRYKKSWLCTFFEEQEGGKATAWCNKAKKQQLILAKKEREQRE